MKHLKISCQYYKIGCLLLPSISNELARAGTLHTYNYVLPDHVFAHSDGKLRDYKTFRDAVFC